MTVVHLVVPSIKTYRQVLFYARVMFMTKSHKSDTKFPCKTVYFIRVREMKTSFYRLYDYTTSVHMDL